MLDVQHVKRQGSDPAAPRVHQQSIQNYRPQEGSPVSTAKDLVALAVSQGGLGNDALLAAVLPLFHATAAVHERGLVAPLRGLDRITVDEQTRLGFAPEEAGRPVFNQPGLD